MDSLSREDYTRRDSSLTTCSVDRFGWSDDIPKAWSREALPERVGKRQAPSIHGLYCMRTVADLLKGRDNNFNLLRFLAAATVIYSHSWALKGSGEPLVSSSFSFFSTTGLRYTPGMLAVQVFFIMSGFLITMSFVRRPHLLEFIAARALRIVPALFVVNVLCAYLLGGLLTTLTATDYYVGQRSVLLHYVSSNSFFYATPFMLPGVFTHNPLSAAVNGCLWSLPHEVWCYGFVLGCGLLGFYRSWFSALLFALASGLLLFASFYDEPFFAHLFDGTPILLNYMRFLFLSFVLGQLLFLLRNWVPIGWWGIALAGIGAVLSLHFSWTSISYNFFLAYLITSLAFVPAGSIRRYNKLPDVSYGMYLYSFPIQQTILSQVPQLPLPLFIILSLILSICVAWLSWTFIEAPALSLLKRANNKRSRGSLPIAPREVTEEGGHLVCRITPE